MNWKKLKTITWKVPYAYGLDNTIKNFCADQVIYRFNPISSKIAMIFFIKLKSNPKMCKTAEQWKQSCEWKTKVEASGSDFKLLQSYSNQNSMGLA